VQKERSSPLAPHPAAASKGSAGIRKDFEPVVMDSCFSLFSSFFKKTNGHTYSP
jgi:hypothetical protein